MRRTHHFIEAEFERIIGEGPSFIFHIEFSHVPTGYPPQPWGDSPDPGSADDIDFESATDDSGTPVSDPLLMGFLREWLSWQDAPERIAREALLERRYG